ncbi:coiled-coil domain-containing protein 73 [Microcaecilia unicolor]|uniref:Coiled-coil domain-containing protein 73 n=1 Tax=Microcaecilia unicolor TaxID=1415580 RepID=A0A6P7Y0F2_9AMPH|nr:coiled-coil domain-containing protein 73 [Microcaecilia unicolor]
MDNLNQLVEGLSEANKPSFQLILAHFEDCSKQMICAANDSYDLAIVKYNLEKKLLEMEQKLQLHILAKEDHLKQLNEVEKSYVSIAYQFGLVKEVHEKLEQNVQAVIQLNQKLTSVDKKKEHEIDHLKQELKKLTVDLLKSKVICQQRAEAENINLIEKEQQLQELQQKLQMENEINKMLNEENIHIKGEKQEIICSLQNVQELLQRQTQVTVSVEAQLNALKEDYQILERDNELQREKAKENEQKFLNLQNEHEKSLGTWKKDNVLLSEQLNEVPKKQLENGCTEVKIGDFNQCGEKYMDKQSMEGCILEFKENQGEHRNEVFKEHNNGLVTKGTVNT